MQGGSMRWCVIELLFVELDFVVLPAAECCS
jgi:hypothetical protein